MKNCAIQHFLLLVLAGGTLVNSEKMEDCKPPVGQDHVLITVGDNEFGRCGGSLLSSKWVLTAAHCNTRDLQVMFGPSPSKKGETRKVIDTKQYSKGSEKHNILLLEIDEAPAKFAKLVAKLPDSVQCKTSLRKGESVKLHSWVIPVGSLDKMTPQNLKCADLKVKDCIKVEYDDKQGVPEELEHENHKLLCTEAKEEECAWYSAGSLVQNDILRGMLINFDLQCKTQIEFLDICHYNEWIKETIKSV